MISPTRNFRKYVNRGKNVQRCPVPVNGLNVNVNINGIRDTQVECCHRTTGVVTPTSLSRHNETFAYTFKT